MEAGNQPGAGSAAPDTLHERSVLFLRTLRRTLSVVTMYGLDHAVSRSQVEESYRELVKVLRLGKRLDIAAFDEDLLLNGQPAPSGDPHLHELARLLKRLKLPGLELLAGVGMQEYEELLSVMARRDAVDPETTVDAATALRRKGLSHIRVQFSQYQRVADDQAVVDRRPGVISSTHPGRSSHPGSVNTAGQGQDVTEWERAWKQQMQGSWDLTEGPGSASDASPSRVSTTGAESVGEQALRLAGEVQLSMRAIGSSVGFMLEENAGPLNDQQRNLLESAQRSIQHAGELLLELEHLADHATPSGLPAE